MNIKHLQNMLDFAAEVIPDTHAAQSGVRHPRKCKACGTVGSMILHPGEVYHKREGGQVVEKEFPSWHECRFCHAQDTV